MGKYDNWFKINSIPYSSDDWSDESRYEQTEMSKNIKIGNGNINIDNNFLYSISGKHNVKFKRMDGNLNNSKDEESNDIVIYIVLGSVIVLLLIILIILMIKIKNKKNERNKKTKTELTIDDQVVSSDNQKDTQNDVTIDINAIPSNQKYPNNSDTLSNNNNENKNTIKVIIPSSSPDKTNDVVLKPESVSTKTQNEDIPETEVSISPPKTNQASSSSLSSLSSSSTEENGMEEKDKSKYIESDSISIDDFNQNLQLWTNEKTKSEIPPEKQNKKSVEKFNENLQLWMNGKVSEINELTEKEGKKSKDNDDKVLEINQSAVKEEKKSEDNEDDRRKTKSIISSESNEEIDADFRNNLKLWTNGTIPGYEFSIVKRRMSKLYGNEKEKTGSIISSESNEEIDPAFKDNLNLWMNGNS